MIFQALDWDSRFFDLSVARVTDYQGDAPALRSVLKDNVADIIYLFSDTSLGAETMEGTPFEAVALGEKVVYERGLEDLPPATRNVVEVPANERAPELFALALQSGWDSRFKRDPYLPPGAFTNLYREWMRKSLSRTMADQVLAHRTGSVYTGFVTLRRRETHASIELIAVAEGHRGRGIGAHLIHAALHDAARAAYDKVRVVTQASNEGACRAYEKYGFVPVRREYVYHLWSAAGKARAKRATPQGA